MMTFKEYVAIARKTNSIPGDLVADMKTDRRLPDRIDSLDRLRSYLRSCNACQEALRAAPAVWRRYQRKLKGC